MKTIKQITFAALAAFITASPAFSFASELSLRSGAITELPPHLKGAGAFFEGIRRTLFYKEAVASVTQSNKETVLAYVKENIYDALLEKFAQKPNESKMGLASKVINIESEKMKRLYREFAQKLTNEVMVFINADFDKRLQASQ